MILLFLNKFPFVSPELRARCDFWSPSLMDERDLIEDMLGKQWHPFVILKEIIEKVPQYVYKIKKREKEGTLYYNCIVNYSLKSLYDLTMFKLNPEICKAFACNILDNEELIIRKKKKKTDEIKRLEKEAEEVKHGSSHLDQDCIDNVEDEKYRKFLIIVSDNSLSLDFWTSSFWKEREDRYPNWYWANRAQAVHYWKTIFMGNYHIDRAAQA